MADMASLARFALEVVGVLVCFRVLVRADQLTHFTRYVDRRRRFSMAEYKEIMRRAGWRCEHHSLVFKRCKQRTDLEADHVHPSWRPTMVSVWQPEHRRAAYFPAGVRRSVIRHGTRETLKRHSRGRR